MRRTIFAKVLRTKGQDGGNKGVMFNTDNIVAIYERDENSCIICTTSGEDWAVEGEYTSFTFDGDPA